MLSGKLISVRMLIGACDRSILPLLTSIRSETTHFGFENVDEKEKHKKVYAVFANVAEKYDLMNDVMSIGIHRFWKKLKDHFVRSLAIEPNARVLDVAGGTGDIAFRAVEHLKKSRGNGTVTVCDINEHMLEVGRQRAIANPAIDKSRMEWICGDAESLPFPDNSFDLYTIAFGIRNCTHLTKVLSEANRVLKPAGKFACLEFSQVSKLLSPFYDFYSFQVIPIMGHLIASDYHSYKYLVESIRKFPDQERYLQMIEDAGFTNAKYESLSFGICSIHTGLKSVPKLV